MRAEHVQYVDRTGRVLHVGDLHMSCIRMRVVQYVGHTPRPQYNSVVHTSLQCSARNIHRSRSPRRQLTYFVRAYTFVVQYVGHIALLPIQYYSSHFATMCSM